MMENRFLLLLLLSSLCLVSSAPAKERDECPNVAPVPNFDPEKFIADWHVSHYLRPDSEPNQMRCGHIQIFLDPSDHLLHGNITALEEDGTLFHREGKINVKDPKNPGILSLRSTDLGDAEFTFTIVDIDYDSHAAYVICAKLPNGKVHYRVGIIGRNHRLENDIAEKLKKTLITNGVDIDGIQPAPCD